MNGIPANWARSLVDPVLFREEQQALAHVWTFLGLIGDVARDGDWIRASIATRSVFVQRFGDELRGFENLCAHRFYPLRNADRGNGPLICGFHHWQYNRDGVAVGIPISADMYGKPPHQVGARLNRIEIATCGAMIFGRFPSAAATQSLEAFLDKAFPLLEAMTPTKRPMEDAAVVEANWKLCVHISLDDYHGPTLHPTTVGRNGFLKVGHCRYFRMGRHSALVLRSDEDGLDRLVEGFRDGSYRSTAYFMLHIFPSLIVTHARADGPFFFINLIQYSPVAVNRTAFRGWNFPTPFGEDLSWFGRAARPLTDLFRHPIYLHYHKQVIREDIAALERLQAVAHQVDRMPMLGALEERITWFEDSLRELAGRAGMPMKMREQETGQ